MAKTNNSTVAVESISYHEGYDEDGELIQERRVTKNNLGRLSGVSIFNPANIYSVYALIGTVESVYDRIENIEDSVSKKEVDEIYTHLDKYKEAISESESLLRAYGQFKENNLDLLCFLTDDKRDQYRAAQFVLGEKGENSGKERAKQWLGEYKHRLKVTLKADKLHVIT